MHIRHSKTDAHIDSFTTFEDLALAMTGHVNVDAKTTMMTFWMTAEAVAADSLMKMIALTTTTMMTL